MSLREIGKLGGWGVWGCGGLGSCLVFCLVSGAGGKYFLVQLK